MNKELIVSPDLHILVYGSKATAEEVDTLWNSMGEKHVRNEGAHSLNGVLFQVIASDEALAEARRRLQTQGLSTESEGEIRAKLAEIVFNMASEGWQPEVKKKQ